MRARTVPLCLAAGIVGAVGAVVGGFVPHAAAAPAVPTCHGHPATIVGTAGDDYLIGTPGDDVIVGLGGDDTIEARSGNDIVCGGAGADYLNGGNGDDLLEGGAAGTSDRGPVPNQFMPGKGSNAIHGSGIDILYYRASAYPVSVRLDRHIAIVHAERSTVEGIRQVRGSRFGDVLVGDEGPNVLLGAAGNDDIQGLGGDDELQGNDGVDRLRGGHGDDVISNDWLGQAAEPVAAGQSAVPGIPEDVNGGSGVDTYGLLPWTPDDSMTVTLASSRLAWSTIKASQGSGKFRRIEKIALAAHDSTVRVKKPSAYRGLTCLRSTAHCTLDLTGAGSDLRVDLQAGTLVEGGHTTRLDRFLNVIGGLGDDLLAGDSRDNDLRGGPGVDSADGRGGLDRCVAETTVSCER